jgi:threonine/homoserine/homoserine lactone efflux protein
MIAFLAASALFAFMPGPAMLYTAAQTIARGRPAGLMAALGLHLGGYVHVIAAAAGLSVLFHSVPTLYLLLKIAGAVYLVWLGIAMLRGDPQQRELDGAVQKSGRRAFVESVTVEVINPKTAMFFLAFLPQFVDGAAAFPVWLQFLILGTIVNIMFSLCDLLCVGIAGTVVTRLRESGSAQRIMRRMGGTVLIGLGTHLALQRN